MSNDRNDPLTAYLREVNEHPRITQEEERRLARLVHERKDAAAAHALVNANLRFVVKVAREYRKTGLRLLDLIQEGNIGLVIAVSRVDPNRRVKLVSYAVWWIRAFIQGFILRNWSMVKMGTTRGARRLFFKMRRAGRALGLDDSDAATYCDGVAGKLGVKPAEVMEMLQRMRGDVSADAPTRGHGDRGTTMLDSIPDDDTSPEDLLIARQERHTRRKNVRSVLRELDERERWIIDMLFYRDRPLTLGQVGARFGFTGERARQLRNRALRKIFDALQRDGHA